eukprot:s4356_g3.t1
MLSMEFQPKTKHFGPMYVLLLVVQIGAAALCAPQCQSLEASFLPEIVLHVLDFLPVKEVMERKVRAVSSNFGCHKVWLTHLFSLVDIDKLQPLSDVPMARERHPIEEFTTCMAETASKAACNSGLALRSGLSEASTSNISISSRKRHSLVAEKAGLRLRGEYESCHMAWNFICP